MEDTNDTTTEATPETPEEPTYPGGGFARPADEPTEEMQ